MFCVKRRLVAGKNNGTFNTVIRCDRDAAAYRGRNTFIGFVIGRENESTA
jgi:hypothetical protein